ncbi:hypothetical protein CLAFUW4_10528 [Fulvia fulva]|uniref:Uncharacterized protein n=1 Tax=Passalora fulva TaxID=5499 RepID=A0A9Q8P7I2_PASFU|nr:uncharacterized protein CLAFUR5_05141 [Fulvia fulva]KAK4615840.1 hypothetical protein CLAFUR4_10533 [Fulvia fulva]KAK4617071.1 hypothetical protein CLAFUR0_10535 [Fulvia fulva]UJO16139.1 hypothetical protein CLAFUR5_05141 [Fulvia fulva]WPV19177.1 hypothetical protein CLAFUW4_10528 [Fulvia fulva]WPV34460.1 hypothetical protein CLAFUW7_10530 [Fulvia fulva]
MPSKFLHLTKIDNQFDRYSPVYTTSRAAQLPTSAISVATAKFYDAPDAAAYTPPMLAVTRTAERVTDHDVVMKTVEEERVLAPQTISQREVEREAPGPKKMFIQPLPREQAVRKARVVPRSRRSRCMPDRG